ERAVGGEQQVRQADGGAEEQQDARDRLGVARRLPRFRRRDRQQRHRREEKDDVDDGFSFLEKRNFSEQVRVGVSREEQHLEEQHAGGPHRGAAAEPRQDQARDQRLHQEQQERRQENR